MMSTGASSRYPGGKRMRRRPFITLLILAAPLLFPVALSSEAAMRPIGSIAAVRALAHAEAIQNPPVELDATVIYHDRAKKELFIDDGTASCYARLTEDIAVLPPGTRVHIRGATVHFGLFPHVYVTGIEATGTDPLPEPYRPNAAEMFLPKLDSDWVEVPAVITGVESAGLGYTLVVEVFGLEFKADIPVVPDAKQRVAELMQRPLLLTGFVGTVFNHQMQMTGRHFFVPSFDHLRPLQSPLDEESAPQVGISSLLTSSLSPRDLVRITGVVTQEDPKGFYLRDESGSTLVRAALSDRHPPGTRVEATGFGAVAPFRPLLRATSVRRISTQPAPAALSLPAAGGDFTLFHNEFVTLDAEFLAIRQGTSDHFLEFRTGDLFFEAVVPASSRNPVPGLTPGDFVRLAGICEFTTDRPMPRPEWINGMRLLLNTPDHLQVLRSAPWWTPQRLLLALGITCCTAVLGLLGVVTLRRQVARQLKLISRKIQSETVSNERDRMARELHDTLEQNLTGLSLQLDGIANAARTDTGKLAHRLELARSMVRHTRSEARRSVWDLRSRILENEGLPAAIRTVAATTANDAGAAIHLDLAENLPPVPPPADFHILRIFQETLTNSIKHSGASRIDVTLAATPQGLVLCVADNGCGFDPARPTEPQLPHFGLIGMRERAARTGAKLDLVSSPGNGCIVTLTLPLSKAITP